MIDAKTAGIGPVQRSTPDQRTRLAMRESCDEGSIFVTKLLRGALEPTKENLQLGQIARGAQGAFTRYEATLSARDQTSVVVSKMLAGDNTEEFRRYVKAAMPEHPAVREITLRIPAGASQ